MKNKKLFTAVLLLAAAAFLFTACPHNTLTAQQKAAYDSFINGCVSGAASNDMDATVVTHAVSEFNTNYASLGIKILDTKPGQPIVKGSTKKDLEARFRPIKL